MTNPEGAQTGGRVIDTGPDIRRAHTLSLGDYIEIHGPIPTETLPYDPGEPAPVVNTARIGDQSPKDKEPWQNRSACKDLNPNIFYIDDDCVDPEGQEALAKRICDSCNVIGPCLDEAFATKEKFAIRGGTTPKERRRILRIRREAPKTA